jgi:hypothetical protein
MSEIQTNQGPTYQPPPRTKSLFAIGVKKVGSRGPLIPWAVTTNGSLQIASEADAKSGGLVATATVPAICVLREVNGKEGGKPYQETFRYDDAIDSFLSDTYEKDKIDFSNYKRINVHHLVDPWVIQEDTDRKLDPDEEQFPYEYIAEKLRLKFQGWLVTESNTSTQMMTLEFNLKQSLIIFKSWINHILADNKPPLTKWSLLGRASCLLEGEDWKLQVQRFPTLNWRFMEKYAGQIWIPSYTNQIRDQAYYYFHLRLLAGWIRHMCNEGGILRSYQMEDYMALAWQLVYQKSGTGSNSMPDTFDSTDIYSQIIDNMFDDTNDAFKWRVYNQKDLMDYMIFHFIKAYVCHAIKAETQEVQYRLIEGDKKLVTAMMELVDHADYDDFGQDNTPYYPMARTNPSKDIMLPCAMKDKATNMAGECDFHRVTPIKGDEFQTIQVEHNEAKSELFDPMNKKEVFMRWGLGTNDARREELEFQREKLIIFRIRFQGITMKGVHDRMFKVGMWLMTQFTGAPGTFKRGYLMDRSLKDMVSKPSMISVLQEIPALQGAPLEIIKHETPTEDQLAKIHEAQQTTIKNPPSDLVQATPLVEGAKTKKAPN